MNKCREILKNAGKNNDALTKLMLDCNIEASPMSETFQGALLGAVLEHIQPEEFSRILDDAVRTWLCECKSKKNGELCEMCILREKGRSKQSVMEGT
jgi:hypothetical protein